MEYLDREPTNAISHRVPRLRLFGQIFSLILNRQMPPVPPAPPFISRTVLTPPEPPEFSRFMM